MLEPPSLVFGNDRFHEFKSAYDWKLNLIEFCKPVIDFTSRSTKHEFSSRSAYQKINELNIITSVCSDFKSTTLDESCEFIELTAPITNHGVYTVNGNKYDLKENKNFLLYSSNQMIHATHEGGLHLHFCMKRTNLNRIIHATYRLKNTKQANQVNLQTRVINGGNLKYNYYKILIKQVSLIDLFDGDEISLAKIGLDDSIQRTILNMLFDGENIQQDNYSSISSVRSDIGVGIICDAIKRFPNKLITLTEMQEMTGLTGRSLQYAFNRKYGCTPREWQRNEHLSKAREFLIDKNNNQSIKQIAYQLGFISTVSFSRFYLARFGELPSETLRRKR